jgi:hypothetical protein
MQNVKQTIISQYGNSPTMLQLIDNMNEYIDPRIDIDNFYDYIWNVETAQGFGLDIWGRIVQIERVISVPADTPNPGGFPFTPGVYTMDDEQYRRVILIKALANITNCTSGSLNQLLQKLFEGRGRCYALDMGGMAMRLTFEFWLEPYEYVILTTTGVSPRPAGVLGNVFQVDVPTTFGFAESIHLQPFDQGTFYVAS